MTVKTKRYAEETIQADPDTLDIMGQDLDTVYIVMIYGEDLGRSYRMKGDSMLVGRNQDCDIMLADYYVSRHHCRLTRRGPKMVLEDLGSRNGTYLHNRRVAGSEQLQDGDQITLGQTILKFLSGDNIERVYHETIHRLATVDSLTGAYNKKHFDKILDIEFGRYMRSGRPLSMLMMDIDLFKDINDRYGHIAGDHLLAQLSDLVRLQIRQEDIFCRYGGEEFAVLLPEMRIGGAIELAQRLCRMSATQNFTFENERILMTISIGVAESGPSTNEPEDLVKVADKFLYEAKRAGRNCVRPASV